MGGMERILYLHGFASSPASGKALYFREWLSRLGAEVEAPELDGGDFEHLTLTAQLAVIERAAAGRPVALIGSSMGGYLAALYAARHAEASKLVLLAPAFGFAARWAEREGREAVERWRRAGHTEVFHYGENRLRKLDYRLLEDAAGYEDYPEFHQPALIFHGAHDDVVPARCSEHFASTHANVRLEILDSGHDLHNVLEYMAAEAACFLGLADPAARAR